MPKQERLFSGLFIVGKRKEIESEFLAKKQSLDSIQVPQITERPLLIETKKEQQQRNREKSLFVRYNPYTEGIALQPLTTKEREQVVRNGGNLTDLHNEALLEVNPTYRILQRRVNANGTITVVYTDALSKTEEKITKTFSPEKIASFLQGDVGAKGSEIEAQDVINKARALFQKERGRKKNLFPGIVSTVLLGATLFQSAIPSDSFHKESVDSHKRIVGPVYQPPLKPEPTVTIVPKLPNLPPTGSSDKTNKNTVIQVAYTRPLSTKQKVPEGNTTVPAATPSTPVEQPTQQNNSLEDNTNITANLGKIDSIDEGKNLANQIRRTAQKVIHEEKKNARYYP